MKKIDGFTGEGPKKIDYKKILFYTGIPAGPDLVIETKEELLFCFDELKKIPDGLDKFIDIINITPNMGNIILSAEAESKDFFAHFGVNLNIEIEKQKEEVKEKIENLVFDIPRYIERRPKKYWQQEKWFDWFNK